MRLESDRISWLECFRATDSCFWQMKDGLCKAQRAREMLCNWGFFYLILYLIRENSSI